ncbi:MAG: amino acid ABC transporter permease [Nitrospira sp.]|nr:amino acid ABC transporter permease [bacterium]MBL7048565.1 amino acid ABC transporter permease [Nitrospira sp.]
MDFIAQLENLRFYLIGPYPKGDMGGLALNIILALLAVLFSFGVGALAGYSRLSCRKYIKIPSMFFIEIIRATPLLMIIFWMYFFLPYIFGNYVTLFWSAVASLSLYAAAYQAEIVRAGIIAVPRGQLEAALSTGMSRYKAMGYVVLPQAFRIMIPSFLSFFVSLFKDTSTVFVIGIIELTQAGVIISQRDPDKMYTAYAIMGIGFWTISFSLSHLARRLEKHVGVFDLESYRPDACRDEFMLMPKVKKTGEGMDVVNSCDPLR